MALRECHIYELDAALGPIKSAVLVLCHYEPAPDFIDRSAPAGSLLGKTTYFALLIAGEAGERSTRVTFDLESDEALRLNSLLHSIKFQGPDGPSTPPIYSRMYIAIKAPADGRGCRETWWFSPSLLTLALPLYGKAYYADAETFKEACLSVREWEHKGLG